MTTPTTPPAAEQQQQQQQQKNAPAQGAILDLLRPLYERQLPLQLGFWLPRSHVDNPAVQYDTKKASVYALSVVVQHVRSSVDLLMVKPAVRVLAVDRRTGSVIGNRAGVSTEASLISDRWSNPLWDEEFSLGPYTDLCNADVVLLFELVDTKPSMRSAQKRKRTGARRLAWGYLHTVDRAGKPNVGVQTEWSPTAKEKDEDVVTSVQLYAYQPDDVAARWQRPIFGLGASPDNVFHEEPHAQGAVAEAYAQYRKQKRIPVDATLQVRTFARYAGDVQDETPAQDQAENNSKEGGIANESPRPSNATPSEMRAAALKRMRGRNEHCIAPTHIGETVRTGRNGSMVVKFSHYGHLLAIGCTSPDVVRLYDTDTGTWRFDCQPHHGLIYDIVWSPDDGFLASVAGDGCCLVHAFRDNQAGKETEVGNGSGNADNNHARQSAPPVLVAVLRLAVPSFLYAVTFIAPPAAVSKPSSSCPRIVTGGADSILRLWNPSDNHEPFIGELSGKYRHSHRINAVVQDLRSGSIFSGDADGTIIVWRTSNYEHPDAESFVASRKLRHVDLLGKPVLSMSVFPSQSGSRLLVLAQPNTLKVFELTTNAALDVTYQGATISNTFTRGCASPDGQIVACATDDGRVLFFSQNGKPLSTPLSSTALLHPVRCLDWHPSQHLVVASTFGENAAVLLLTASRTSIHAIQPQLEEPVPLVAPDKTLDSKPETKVERDVQVPRQARLAELTARLADYKLRREAPADLLKTYS